MKGMKKLILAAMIGASISVPLSAVAAVDVPVARIQADEVVVTEHSATINGQRFKYKAMTGTQPVFNESGDAIAALHFTYYERQGVKNQERSEERRVGKECRSRWSR